MIYEYETPRFDKQITEPIVFSQLVDPQMVSTLPKEAIPPHLAWQYTRRISNPTMLIPSKSEIVMGKLSPSGFEPYFIETGLNPGEVIQEIAHLGDQQLKLIDPQNSGWRGRLLSILRSGNIASSGDQLIVDLQLLKEADLVMATLTNKLRTGMNGNKFAQQYRDETYELITPYASTLICEGKSGTFMESYKLPIVERSSGVQFFTKEQLNTFSLSQGWDFISLIGERIAHPVVRTALNSVST